MSTATEPKLMTAEEFVRLPDDGVRRDLVGGRVVEDDEPMTWRNRKHCEVEASLVRFLGNWREDQGVSGGVLSGEVGFRIRRDPDVLYGVDVAFASGDLLASSDPDLPYLDGPPTLAVEILSPSDRHGKVTEKVLAYLAVGTVVWVVDPDLKTVSVYQAGRPVRLAGVGQEIDGGDDLPGLRIDLSRVFR